MLLCAATQAVVSWTGKRDPDKEKLVWTDLTGHSSRDLAKVAIGLLVSIALVCAASAGGSTGRR